MTEKRRTVFGKISDKISRTSGRRKSAEGFAKKHGLIYFSAVDPDGTVTPVIRGSTSSLGQVDSHFCIGSHDGYDMVLFDRLSNISCVGYKSSIHHWYVLEIDLHSARNLPYIFIGTRQQSKAYYAKLLSSHRHLRYLSVDTAAHRSAEFHGNYAVLSSPADVPTVYRLLTDDMIETMAAHGRPFAIEIEGDSLMLITEASKPSQQLLDKLLHYGLWLAKEIDDRLA